MHQQYMRFICKIGLTIIAVYCSLVACSSSAKPVSIKASVKTEIVCKPSKNLWLNEQGSYRLVQGSAATDSAASATAMATGCKTVNSAIGTVPKGLIPREDNPRFACRPKDIENRGSDTDATSNVVAVKNISEYARDKGALVGVVSSVPFNHATPAAFLAHTVGRGSYEEIAKQILDSVKPDVIIAGGHPASSSDYLSEAVWKRLLEDQGGAYSDMDIIGVDQCRINGKQFKCAPNEQLILVSKQGKNKIVALLGGKIHCDRCNGKDYSEGLVIPHRYKLSPDLSSASYNLNAVSVETNNMPRLADAAESAIRTLERRSVSSGTSKGFFLMVEGGDIDWANHENDFAWMLAAMHEFEDAVKSVVKYVDESRNLNWSNTLLIVTADHANSMMRVNIDALKKLHAAGKTPIQRWVDAPKTKNGLFDSGEWFYGESKEAPVVYRTTGHTNELVTINARGKGSKALFEKLESQRPCSGAAGQGIIDNTQIFEAMLLAFQELGIEHVVLMIGDGMHVAHEAAYSIVRYGEPGKLEWNGWSSDEKIESYAGKVTTWDVSAYDQRACIEKKQPFNPETCESKVGYDEAMTPDDPLSISAVEPKAETYFLIGLPKP